MRLWSFLWVSDSFSKPWQVTQGFKDLLSSCSLCKGLETCFLWKIFYWSHITTSKGELKSLVWDLGGDSVSKVLALQSQELRFIPKAHIKAQDRMCLWSQQWGDGGGKMPANSGSVRAPFSKNKLNTGWHQALTLALHIYTHRHTNAHTYTQHTERKKERFTYILAPNFCLFSLLMV